MHGSYMIVIKLEKFAISDDTDKIRLDVFGRDREILGRANVKRFSRLDDIPHLKGGAAIMPS
jgi:hypothetical protein